MNPPQSTDIMYLADIITSLSNKGGYTATASALIEAQRVLREINREREIYLVINLVSNILILMFYSGLLS